MQRKIHVLIPKNHNQQNQPAASKALRLLVFGITFWSCSWHGWVEASKGLVIVADDEVAIVEVKAAAVYWAVGSNGSTTVKSVDVGRAKSKHLSLSCPMFSLRKLPNFIKSFCSSCFSWPLVGSGASGVVECIRATSTCCV